MTKTYGETLKERRKAKGITIVELSERTKISQADLVNVEVGRKELTLEQMNMIERAI